MNIKEILKPFLSAFIKHLRQESLSRNERKSIKKPLLNGLLEGSVSGYTIDGEKVSQILFNLSKPSSLPVSHFVDQILDCIEIKQKEEEFELKFSFWKNQVQELDGTKMTVDIQSPILNAIKANAIDMKNDQLRVRTGDTLMITWIEVKGTKSQISGMLAQYKNTNPKGLQKITITQEF